MVMQQCIYFEFLTKYNLKGFTKKKFRSIEWVDFQETYLCLVGQCLLKTLYKKIAECSKSFGLRDAPYEQYLQLTCLFVWMASLTYCAKTFVRLYINILTRARVCSRVIVIIFSSTLWQGKGAGCFQSSLLYTEWLNQSWQSKL